MCDNKPAISFRDVVFRYQEKGKRNILDHVDLDIRAGAITVLMGSSGCGKSTFAAVAAGLYPENGGYLEGGEIRLFGDLLSEMNQQKRAAYLTVLFQNADLQFCMNTLRKEMFFCMENICIPREEMDDRAERAAARLGVTDLLDQTLHTLSGGEKQRAALACLYVMESRCILLDESFANLDRPAVENMMPMLRQMKAEGRTIVAIDHQADLWLPLADEIVLMKEGGGAAARGICRENIEQFKTVFEEQGVFFPGGFERKVPERTPGKSVLSLKDVSIVRGEVQKKRFGQKMPELPLLLKEADAEFPEGGMTAVLGPSGCGKTTTFLSVLKQHPYTGQILLNGQDIKNIRPKDLYRKIGIVFQNPANQFITQNVEEEVCASLRVWDKKLTEENCKEKARELLDSYGLGRFHRYSPYMLSQGQQRRLAVLSVLAGGQKLLLLDEPTYGQDDRSSSAIMAQLRQKMQEEGLTVIFITHDRKLAAAWADKIYMLEDRKLVEKTYMEVKP